jgi:endonuclease/exonuclease/phosphatase family metal-dependent hydrolase
VAWRVLTWNLKHGRAVPSAGRELLGEFTAALRGWEWDLALLQEVPPWWPAELATSLGAEQRLVLTSRNAGLALRRAVAVRRPDLIKSNGGGANAILVRRGGLVTEHRIRRLSRLPERRWVHGVRLAGAPDGSRGAADGVGGPADGVGGTWVCNLHAAADAAQGALAAATASTWARGLPIVLGGDFNLPSPALEQFGPAGGHGVDHVFVRGLTPVGPAEVLAHGVLSDHAPVVVTVRQAGRDGT